MFGKKKLNMQTAKLKLIEDKISSLVDILITNSADIYNAPNSDQYFLVDSERGISIGLEYSRVKVANHDFTYSEPLTLKFLEKLKGKVREALEQRTQALKKELFRNEIDLLNKIKELYEV